MIGLTGTIIEECTGCKYVGIALDNIGCGRATLPCAFCRRFYNDRYEKDDIIPDETARKERRLALTASLYCKGAITQSEFYKLVEGEKGGGTE